MFVERSGVLVDGVYHDEPSCDDLRRGDDPRERVREEGPAMALPVQRPIEGKPREQNSRNAVGAAVPDASGQIGTLEQVCSDGVVGDHRAVCVEPDECASRATRRSAASLIPQPPV